MKRLLSVSITSGLLVTSLLALAPSSAAAQSKNAVYDWGSKQVPVLVTNKSGVFFVGKDLSVYRVYRWKMNDGKGEQPLLLQDIDKDGKPELVGMGTPTFAVDVNADPTSLVLKKGCRHALMADVMADEKPELVCTNRREVKVYTYDGQFAWGASAGRPLERCVAGDVNGDTKADVECKFARGKNYIRIDGSGEVIAANTPEQEIKGEGAALTSIEPVAATLLDGKSHFDFDGDGNADEYFTREDKGVAMRSKASSKTLAAIDLKGKALAGIVKDIDGDKKMEAVFLTDKNIVIVSKGGKKVDFFSANAKKYKRQPVAQLASVYANGFKDSEAAKKAVTDAQEKLAKCYRSRVRKSMFTGSGRLLLRVIVDEKGKVKTAQDHSEINDKKIEKCTRRILEKIKYPEGAGKVTVNLRYTFRDK